MSKKPRPDKFERAAPNDSITGSRARSPSSANFDGTSTWSPSNFRKTLDLTKMLGRTAIDGPKLDKLLEESSKSPLSFPALVGSKEYADVVFHVGSHAIYAHRCVLESRCPPLFNLAIKDKGKKGHLQTIKSDEKVIELRSLSLVLEYLYTGSVPFTHIVPAEVIPLIAHAELFQIDRLRWLCERYLQTVLSLDLFFTLLFVSDSSGVARAKKLCMAYGALHFEEIIVRKDQVHSLGLELFREFVVYSTMPSEIAEDLNQLSFPNTIREEFKIIYTAMTAPDAFFVFKNANTTVPCHKAVLFAQSESFKTLFSEEGHANSENRFALPKNLMMPHEAFKSFLAWCYYRDTSFSAEHAAMILPLAHQFGIESLVGECDEKLKHGISVTSVLPILTLCFSEWGKKGYKAELAQPCLEFLVLNFGNVDLTEIKSSAIAAAIANAVRNAVISGVWVPVANGETKSSAPVASDNEGTMEESSSAAPNGADAPTKLRILHKTDDSITESDEGKRSARRKKRRTMQLDASITDEASSSAPATPVSATRKSKTNIHADVNTTGDPETPKEVKAEEPVIAASVDASVKVETSEKVETHAEEPKSEPEPATTPATKPAAAENGVASETTSSVAPTLDTAENPSEQAEPAPKSSEKKSEKVEKASPTKEPKSKSSEAEKPASSPTKAEVKVEAKSEAKGKSEAEAKSEAKSEAKETTTAALESPSGKRVKVSSRSESAAKAKKSETSKSDATKSDATEIPVTRTTSTQDKRANFEPSTSVKAIKESFEAKGREETEKQQADEKLKAGRRKDGKSK